MFLPSCTDSFFEQLPFYFWTESLCLVTLVTLVTLLHFGFFIFPFSFNLKAGNVQQA